MSDRTSNPRNEALSDLCRSGKKVDEKKSKTIVDGTKIRIDVDSEVEIEDWSKPETASRTESTDEYIDQ